MRVMTGSATRFPPPLAGDRQGDGAAARGRAFIPPPQAGRRELTEFVARQFHLTSIPAAQALQDVDRGKSVGRLANRDLELAQCIAGLAAESAVRFAYIEAVSG